MIPVTSGHAPYRAELEAALQRLDALRAQATECEACAERAERRERRRAAVTNVASTVAGGALCAFLAAVALTAFVTGLLAILFALFDGGSPNPPCADLGCVFGARPENVPYELAVAALAFGCLWAAGRALRWAVRRLKRGMNDASRRDEGA